MKLNLLAHWKEVALIVAVVLAGIFFKAWLEGHDQALLAQAQIKEQQSVIQQKDFDIQQAQIDRDKILAHEQDELQTIARTRAAVLSSSPREQLDALSAAIQQPLKLEDNAQTGKQDAVLPDAPSALPNVLDFIYKCQECSTSLAARASEISDLNYEIKSLNDKVSAVEAQRDAALKIHGTGFWNRAKWLAIGAGGGALTYAIIRH